MRHSEGPPPPQTPVPPPGYVLLQQDPAGPAGESAELFDWALIGSCAGFVLHSIWRHKRLFLLVWVGIIAVSIGLMVSMPKTYQVQTVLQAERKAMPGLSLRENQDAPTRLAAETVQRYDNLVALIQQTELIKNWPLRRAPMLRVKDFFFRRLFAPPTREQQIVSFAYYLRDKLWVATGEGRATIGIDFHDGELA